MGEPVVYTVEEFRSLVLPRILTDAKGLDGGKEFASVTEQPDGSVLVEVDALARQPFVIFALTPDSPLPPTIDEVQGWICDTPGCRSFSQDVGNPLFRCLNTDCGFAFPGDDLVDMSVDPQSGRHVNAHWRPGVAGERPLTIGQSAARVGVFLDPVEFLQRKGATAAFLPAPGLERCPVCGGIAHRVSEFSCLHCSRGAVAPARAVVCPECGHLLGEPHDQEPDDGPTGSALR